jgi:UDPglucose--hexose-1-phosphate uridylyltransferase
MKELQELSHKRLNILTNEWVLVSPHRTKRPWQGKQEKSSLKDTISYDENCYLCPGNKRASGDYNPKYEDVYVFNNDFAALNEGIEVSTITDGLLQAQTEKGICRVVCFSPDHSKSLANMTVAEITKVVNEWQRQYAELGALPDINYVQIFENKGDIMGCSNPHPHGQIWSQSSLPNEVVKKDKAQKSYFQKQKRSILADYLNQELALNERIIYENEGFVILVPFWAIWPYETMIVPKEHKSHIGEFRGKDGYLFADAIATITANYDKVFDCAFPYSSGIHQAPTNNEDNSHWHMHMSFYPPLLRSATVKKFMVGYEMFGMPQRDITPEFVAKQLRGLITGD